MGMVAWVMMGIAVWHFAVWVPDHFVGGIAGAILAALFGAILFGLVVNGFTIPGIDDTTIVTAFEAIPGAILGLTALWLEGRRRDRAAGIERD